MAFTVNITTMNNLLNPELVDTTIILLKSVKPFVQMSYQYDGDFSTLSDEDAIAKVLDDFYNQNYQQKIMDAKITELELTQLQQQQSIDALTQDVTALKGGTTA